MKKWKNQETGEEHASLVGFKAFRFWPGANEGEALPIGDPENVCVARFVAALARGEGMERVCKYLRRRGNDYLGRYLRGTAIDSA